MVDNILHNLSTLLRLYSLYGKMDLMWFLRDTRYCLLYMISDLICSLSSICGIFLLSENFGGFGGMNQQEVLFMLSYAVVVQGLYMMFFLGNNTGMVSRIIGRGHPQLQYKRLHTVQTLHLRITDHGIPTPR